MKIEINLTEEQEEYIQLAALYKGVSINDIVQQFLKDFYTAEIHEDETEESQLINRWCNSYEWIGEYTGSFLQYLNRYYINTKDQIKKLLENPDKLKELYKFYREETKKQRKDCQTYTAAVKQIKRFLK